jgi:hypothetical protein
MPCCFSGVSFALARQDVFAFYGLVVLQALSLVLLCLFNTIAFLSAFLLIFIFILQS